MGVLFRMFLLPLGKSNKNFGSYFVVGIGGYAGVVGIGGLVQREREVQGSC